MSLTVYQKLTYYLPPAQQPTIVGHYKRAGRLDRNRLLASLRQLMCMHETLRCSFERRWLQVRAVIWDVAQLDVERLVVYASERGISGTPAHDALPLRDLAKARRFEFSSPPLFQLYVDDSGTEHTELILSIHHIVSDLDSIDVFFKDLMEIYATERLRAEPLQFYAHVAARSAAQKRNGELKRNYDWHRGMRKERSSVPAGLLREKVEPNRELAGRGEIAQYIMNAGFSMQLSNLCASFSAGPHIVFMAAMGILSSSRLGRVRLMIFSEFNNRRHARATSVIGFVANAVTVYVEVSPEMSCGDLVRQAKRNFFLGCLRSELSISQLVALRIRSGKVANLEFVGISFGPKHHYLLPMEATEGTEYKFFECDHAVYGLSIIISESPDGRYIGETSYPRSLYSRSLIKRSIEDLHWVVLSICQDPSARVGDLVQGLTAVSETKNSAQVETTDA